MKRLTIVYLLFVLSFAFIGCGKSYSDFPNQILSYYDSLGYEIPDYSQETLLDYKVQEALVKSADESSFLRLDCCKSEKDAKDIYKRLKKNKNKNLKIKESTRNSRKYLSIKDTDSSYLVYRFGANIVVFWNYKDNESKATFLDCIDSLQ